MRPNSMRTLSLVEQRSETRCSRNNAVQPGRRNADTCVTHDPSPGSTSHEPDPDCHQDWRPRNPVVAPRRGRRPHGRRGRAAQGDGLRDGRRAAGRCRPVHRLHPDGGLRVARLVARAQRQFDGDAGDTDRHATRTRRARRRPGEARHGDGHAGRAGRRDAARGQAAEARVRGELHFHAGADRLQGRGRPGGRARPDAQAHRCAHHQARLLCRRPEPGAACSGHIVGHARGGRGDLCGTDRHGAAVAALSGAPGGRRRQHRRVVVLRAAGPGRLDGRSDSARAAVAHAAGSFADRATGAGRARHRADELHRDDCGGPRLCPAGRACHRREPRTRRHRVGQPGGRAVRRDAGGRRHVADGGGALRGRTRRRRRRW